MFKAYVYLIVTVLGVFQFGNVTAGVEILQEENGRIVVDVRFGAPGPTGVPGSSSKLNTPGLPPLGYERFYVAIPAGGVFRVSRIDGVANERVGNLPLPVENHDKRGILPTIEPGPGYYPENPIVVTGPFTFRKTRVIAVDCYVSQVDRAAGVERVWQGYRVEVSYPAHRSYLTADRADPLVAGTVINKSFLPVPGTPATAPDGLASGASPAGNPDPHFSLSQNWMKIRVDTAGVYALDAVDFAALGVDPSSINDPGSFRLFTHGGTELERRDAMRRPYQDMDGTWRPGNWMNECDIFVDYGGDGTFDPGDKVIFYGVGSRGWRDFYERGAPRYEFHDHLYTKGNYYYLTWDDTPGFSGVPGRMALVNSAPQPANPDVIDFEERLFFERNQVEALSFGGDGWLWIEVSEKTGPETITFQPFEIYNFVDSRPQTFRTLALAPYIYGESNRNHHAVYRMNGAQITDSVFDNPNNAGYENAIPVEKAGSFLLPGTNTFQLNIPRDLNPSDFMYFDLYSVFYYRQLTTRGGSISFGSPDTTGSVNFRATNFSPGSPIYLFDVSDQFKPRFLSSFERSDVGGRDQIRFSSQIGGGREYYWAGNEEALRKPATMIRHFPRDLRNVTSSPNMLIVSHPDFMAAATRLKQHRQSHYPYGTNPDIEIVTTVDVFDNFSGGMIDPIAIRNYCKFLYDNYDDGNGNTPLSFLLLLGDANNDYKNNITNQENFVTTNLNLAPGSLDAYATDDWFVEMEQPDSTGASYMQIAVGRIPAGSSQDAMFLVDRIVDYQTAAEFGPWRNRAILVADDEVTPSHPPQPMFVSQTESIAHGYMANFHEARKIYLTEYPFVGSIKPASRLEFLNEWNDGALMINYIGHGSSVQMADEQVFLGSDVANLRNGLRLPLFMAFSCTIGDFGRAQTVSLSEKLLLWTQGGAIATITASEVSLIDPNASLNTRFFLEVSPRTPGPPEPLGVALLRAKTSALSVSVSKRIVEENSHKYNLLGDPALQLVMPTRSVKFNVNDVDTMTTGKRQVVRGWIYRDGQTDTGFNGNVNLVVREPDDGSGYTSEDGVTFIPYRYARGTVYEGTADVRQGEFEFNFKIPRSAGTGPVAFERAYVDDGQMDAIALCDTTVFSAPSPGDTTVLTPIDGSPRVDFGFKGGQTIVKPGAILQARVNDLDGVNILNTTPEGKIALVFDQTNLPIDVTDSFQFDHGGTDTSGTLGFPLPELSVGGHRAILKVADSFGQVTLDTLEFSMTDPQDFVAQVVLNYPNPFTTTTYFLVNLTDRADIQIDLFTISGKRIRRLEQMGDPGEVWINWDGKDSVGDSIANGTYLYVARVSFVGLDRAPVVLRGKVAKIE